MHHWNISYLLRAYCSSGKKMVWSVQFFLSSIQQAGRKLSNPSARLYVHINRMLCLWVNKPTFINEMDTLTLTTGYQKMEEAIIYGVHKQSNSLPTPVEEGGPSVFIVVCHCSTFVTELTRQLVLRTGDKAQELSWWYNSLSVWCSATLSVHWTIFAPSQPVRAKVDACDFRPWNDWQHDILSTVLERPFGVRKKKKFFFLFLPAKLLLILKNKI